MNSAGWRSWGGIALVLLGLINALTSKGGPWSTLVTIGLVFAGMTVKGYEISLRAWHPEECRRALKRSWIGVGIIFLGLAISWFFFRVDFLLFGFIFAVVGGTVGPILAVSYLRCLRGQ